MEDGDRWMLMYMQISNQIDDNSSKFKVINTRKLYTHLLWIVHKVLKLNYQDGKQLLLFSWETNLSIYLIKYEKMYRKTIYLPLFYILRDRTMTNCLAVYHYFDRGSYPGCTVIMNEPESANTNLNSEGHPEKNPEEEVGDGSNGGSQDGCIQRCSVNHRPIVYKRSSPCCHEHQDC